MDSEVGVGDKTAITSDYTGAAQEIAFEVGIGSYEGERSDIVFSLTDEAGSDVDFSVEWNLNDEGEWVAVTTAEVTNVDTYTFRVAAPGEQAKTATHTIAAISLDSLTYELSSGEYLVGETPTLKSVKTAAGEDVTPEILNLIKDGKIKAYVRTAITNDENINPADFKVGKSYYYVLQNIDQNDLNYAVGYTDSSAASFSVAADPELSTSQQAFVDGKALEGKDQDGKVVKADDKGAFSVLAVKGKDIYVVPTSVMPKGASNAVAVELANGDKIEDNLFNDSKGASKAADVQAAGTYYVSVKASDSKSAYAGATLYVPMTVKAYAYDTVAVFNADSDNNGKDDVDTDKADYDFDNSSFVYDGADQFVGIAVDGEDVTDDLANVTLYGADGKAIAEKTTVSNLHIKSAGTYTIAGELDGVLVQATFTVEKLDLANTSVVTGDVALADGYNGAMAATKVNGIVLDACNNNQPSTGTADGVVDIEGVMFSVSPAITKEGAYKATVSAVANDENVTGSKTVDFNVVKEDVSTHLSITYAGGAFQSSYYATGKYAFDAEQLGLAFDDGDDEYDFDADEYTMSITDSKGNSVDGGFKVGETYYVTARLVVDSEFSKGGTATGTFTVSDGAIDGVTVTYKGDVATSGMKVAYTGEDAFGDFEFTVKDGKKVLTEGTDYELVLKQDGKVVDGAVEAGHIYTVEVKGLTYTAPAGAVFSFTIGDMQVTDLKLDLGNMGVVAWTGKAVEPVVLYTTDSIEKAAAGTAEYSVLPADFYVAKYENTKTGKAVSEVVDEGDYKVTITPSTKAENISFNAKTIEFAVSKTLADFVDVSTSEWYANVVAKANGLGYMTGISGTAMFAPNATITRAEVAEVFAKMAGLQLDKDKTYPTKFSDVPSDAWFAQSVAWASQAGIVGGYDGTDLFGSFDEATREQVATMIYRYAAVAGLDTSVEDEAAALASYKDASQLTFGKTAMAWCVENGIMGVDTDSLNPLANMSRAEMAATAVRVQPEKLA